MFYRGSKYYLETRFMFAFVLIGLFFAVCALFLSLLALCSRIGSFLSSALCSVALFFQTLTAALMTFVPFPLFSSATNLPPPKQRRLRPRPLRLPLLLPHRHPRQIQLRLHVGRRRRPLPRHFTRMRRRRHGQEILREELYETDRGRWEGIFGDGEEEEYEESGQLY